MLIKKFKDYIDGIDEGLIKTYDSDKALEQTLSVLGLLGFNVNGTSTKDKIKLEIFEFDKIPKNQIEYFMNTIDSYLINIYGWFPSSMKIINVFGMERLLKYEERILLKNQDSISSVVIEYDSKFDQVINQDFEKLYHLSINEYNNKILKKGLYPKSKSKATSHLDRIYVCTNALDCEKLINQMKLSYSHENDFNVYNLGKKLYKKDTRWIIYEIDNINKYKLYKDPRYIDGYYTLQNIEPKYIKIYSKEKGI